MSKVFVYSSHGRSRRFVCSAVGLLLAVGAWLWSATVGAAAGLSPDSPEVREAVAKGLAFLETQNGGAMGGQALLGLTMVKSGARLDHPKIREAVATIKGSLAGGVEKLNSDVYSVGVSIMFLVAVNPKEHRYEIEALVRWLHLKQKEYGAWGYPLDGPNGKTCDTSMTQFAAMGLWEAADQAEVDTPPEVWERLAKWLLRTQDPNGGFGYQGVESGKLGERVRQPSTLHSMTCAGMCSLYICKDQLGMSRLRRRSNDDTPAALRPLENDDQNPSRVKTRLEVKLVQKARADGNHWMSANFTIEKPKGWLHYYMYALERYETFRQMETDGPPDTAWYDRGARFLLKTQGANGSWESEAKNPHDTSFALLFLLRSTKKSLERSKLRFREGILAGGRGVPAAGELRLRDGKVVVKPAAAAFDRWAAILETPASAEKASAEKNGAEYAQAVEALADLAESGDRRTLDQHAALLRRLAGGAHREARLAAVRACGRSRNLDHVPTLIGLLEDADIEVALTARDALRVISRRLDAFGFDARGGATARKEAIERWKTWYRSLRPDAELD
ncbi:MAG TPA: prenyltransferase/squalene oxidase repeat-containing protein [Pirellulales bacterium]|nr:prenyltransferase/squalene oxidase repeat-containing protein [Pirellulales bacterium]